MKMFKYLNIILGAALFMGVASEAVAGEKDVLHKMIFEQKSLSAEYAQTVYSAENKVLQEQTGQMFLLRPNYFRMDTVEPDSATIVADGHDVYSYDEMLEQVTIYSFEQQLVSSPLMLIISDDGKLWDDYTVTRSSHDSFSVLPKSQNGNVHSMTLTFNDDNTLKELRFVEKDGKYSIYSFIPIKDSVPTPADFKYVIPEGVTVDDQRTK